MGKKVFIELLAPGTMVGVVMVTGVFLFLTNTHADDTVSTATISVPVACTMSGTGTDSHTATIPNGTVQENIGTTTMKVYCNDSEGFSVYAAGFSDDTLGNTYLHDATLGASDDILTGTTFTGTSQWAMKIGATTGTYPSTIAGSEGDSEKQTGDTDYSTWAEIPSSYTRVAYRNSGTDVNNESAASAEGSSITATYKAFINSTQKAGTYVGKVKFTMVHPASEEPLQPQPSTAGCINYFTNASDAEGTMGCQSATDNTEVTLLASNFSRTGYGFAGWSDAYDYATNPNTHFYGPSETITAPEGTTANGLSLYAVWVESEGSLQDTSKVASVCSSLTTAPTDGTANLTSVSALTDQRDNETYAIAKLADGNCWMIENLRLESTTEHNSDGTLSQGYGGQFAGLANAEPAWASNSTTANSLYSTDGADGAINIGTNYAGYRFPRYNNVNTPTTASDRPQNPTRNTDTNTTSNASMYSYGNYYTWSAAIADTTDYSSGEHNTTSICPTGWKLPLGNTSTGNIDQGASDSANKVPGFSYLDRKMGGTGADQSTAADSLRWRKYPVNTVYSGYVDSGSVGSRGTYGSYWSSTASSSSNAYYLALSSSSVNPGTGYTSSKYLGRTVRCVVFGV